MSPAGNMEKQHPFFILGSSNGDAVIISQQDLGFEDGFFLLQYIDVITDSFFLHVGWGEHQGPAAGKRNDPLFIKRKLHPLLA